MANIKGSIETFDQVGEHEDLAETIRDASDYDTPVFSFIARGRATNTEHRWVHDRRSAYEVVLSEAAQVTATDTTITLSSANAASHIGSGWLVKVDDEFMHVTSVSSTNLTVTRAYSGTTGSSHSSTATMRIVGPLGAQGADALTANATLKVLTSNYTQIFQDTILVSFTERGVRNVGGDEYDYQVMKKLKEHAVHIEEALIHGQLTAPGGSQKGTLRGVRNWITSNTTSAQGVLLKNTFNSKVRAAFQAGGRPDTIIAGYLAIEAMTQWQEIALQSRSGDTEYGANVLSLITPYGKMDVIPSNHVGTDKGDMLILQSNLMKWCPLYGDMNLDTKLWNLSRTGSADKSFIYTEGTLEFSNEYAHATLFGVTAGA